jgi:nitrogen fixation protein FixH
MQLNWGHKITFVFIGFASMMFYLIYKCNQTNFELVSKDYYKEELAYQQVIDGTNNANQLQTNTNITIQGTQVSIQLPNEMQQKHIKGNVHFYCPTDARKDQKFNLTVNDNATFQVPHAVIPGKYIVKISWQADNNNYYQEKEIQVL